MLCTKLVQITDTQSRTTFHGRFQISHKMLQHSRLQNRSRSIEGMKNESEEFESAVDAESRNTAQATPALNIGLS